MKRFLVGVCALGVMAVFSARALAQSNPRGTTKVTLNGKVISVEYGRPALKGRSVQDLLARLQPDQPWRLGADKSTTFSTTADLVFGDLRVPRGDYSLWARHEADHPWKLVFNKRHGQWGTDYDSSQDLGAVELKETKAGKSEDQVTIRLAREGKGGVLTIQWGDLQLSTGFAAK